MLHDFLILLGIDPRVGEQSTISMAADLLAPINIPLKT